MVVTQWIVAVLHNVKLPMPGEYVSIHAITIKLLIHQFSLQKQTNVSAPLALTLARV